MCLHIMCNSFLGRTFTETQVRGHELSLFDDIRHVRGSLNSWILNHINITKVKTQCNCFVVIVNAWTCYTHEDKIYDFTTVLMSV